MVPWDLLSMFPPAAGLSFLGFCSTPSQIVAVQPGQSHGSHQGPGQRGPGLDSVLVGTTPKLLVRSSRGAHVFLVPRAPRSSCRRSLAGTCLMFSSRKDWAVGFGGRTAEIEVPFPKSGSLSVQTQVEAPPQLAEFSSACQGCRLLWVESCPLKIQNSDAATCILEGNNSGCGWWTEELSFSVLEAKFATKQKGS